jgi:hypothetical protein
MSKRFRDFVVEYALSVEEVVLELSFVCYLT